MNASTGSINPPVATVPKARLRWLGADTEEWRGRELAVICKERIEVAAYAWPFFRPVIEFDESEDGTPKRAYQPIEEEFPEACSPALPILFNARRPLLRRKENDYNKSVWLDPDRVDQEGGTVAFDTVNSVWRPPDEPLFEEMIDFQRAGTRLYLVGIGATWCEPCVKEFPEFLKLAEAVRAWNGHVVQIFAEQRSVGQVGLQRTTKLFFEKVSAHAGEAVERIDWVEYRGDVNSAWASELSAWAAKRAEKRDELSFRAGEIPQLMIFNARGDLLLFLQEPLEPDLRARIEYALPWLVDL